MTRNKRVALYMLYIFIANIFINFGFIDKVNSKEYFTEETQMEKIIYLTFDDGPSSVTPKVLDVLKEKNVNATFFIIGNQIKGYEEVVKRICNEGHSIGLHTYTHKFKNIYCSKEAFIKEMYSCRDEIEKVVNVSPSIIRFPGGSRSRLNKEFLKELHNLNFKIYDWNMVIPDGMNPKAPPDKLFREATKKNR